ncbi:MAG: RodZ domain-containing protein [Vicinamibacterales bacterium]
MSIGAQLRAAREARGLTLDAVARATRVQPRILAAIERDDVAAVPPRPFGRGFVKAYAAEMGLDPEQVTHDYFARFAPAAAEAPIAPAPHIAHAPSRTWVYAVGVIGLAVGVALAFLTRTPGPETPPPSTQPAVGTSGTTAVTTPVSGSTTTDTAAPLRIVLRAQRPAWVTATADGHRQIYRILTPGAPTHLSASREVTIRVGDAGAITWQVNGREAGLMGRSGQVRDVRLTAGNAGTVQ